MARNRNRVSTGRRFVVFGSAVIILLVAWWQWPREESTAENRAPLALTGIRPDDGANGKTANDRESDSPYSADPQPTVPLKKLSSNDSDPAEDTADDQKRRLGFGGTSQKPKAKPESSDAKESNAPLVRVPPSPSTQPSKVSLPKTEHRSKSAMVRSGLEAKRNGDLIQARALLNEALTKDLSSKDARQAREALQDLAKRMIFSTGVVKGDTLADYHTVVSGETLGKIAAEYHLNEDLLAQINNIPNKNFIRQGQRLKVVRGPFHAVVSKSDHLIHLYLQDVYVETYPVALGSNGGTPAGKWKVKNHQPNPGWVDPRTGERWHPDDPKNPIGEFWIGLEGIEGEAVGAFGYGIHGTIEPETIGQDVSLGCVRLAPKQIARVYKLLVPGHSFVTITD